MRSPQRVNRIAPAIVIAIAEFLMTCHGVAPAVAASAPLAPPAGIVVTASYGDVIIAWNAAAGAVSYEVMGMTDPTPAAAVTVATLPKTSLGYRHKGAGSNPVYYYQVVSVAKNGTRAASALVKFAAPVSTATTAATIATPSGLANQPAPVQAPPAVPRSAVDLRIPAPSGAATTPAPGNPLPMPTQRAGTPTAAASPGPVVTGLAVVTRTSTTLGLSWTAATGATGYNVYQSVYGGPFKLVATAAAGTGAYTGTGLVPGVAYSYKITAVFAGGEGTAAGPVTGTTGPGLPPKSLIAQLELDRAGVPPVSNPACAAEASGNTAASSPVWVQLSWPAVPEAAGYLVIRDGTALNSATNPCTALTFSDRSMAAGVHSYSVASVYKTADYGLEEGQLSGLPTATVPVVYGVYRVTLTRITVTHATNDTAFGADGQGDEIYVVSDTDVIQSVDPGRIESLGSVRSWTYGDVAFWSGRVRAGSASGTGGLQTGDALPDSAPSCTPSGSNQLCIPMELFRGLLIRDAVGVYLTPRVWETDNGGGTDVFVTPLVAAHTSAMQAVGRAVIKAVLVAAASTRSSGGYLAPDLTYVFPSGPISQFSQIVPGSVTNLPSGARAASYQSELPCCGKDRPIGLTKAANGGASYDDIVLPLNYDLAQSLASGTLRFADYGIGEFPVTLVDDHEFGGVYTLLFRVDRCTSVAQC